MLIGDHFTKWYEAIPLPDKRAETTADALLKHWICRFGCPHSIHTDQGRNFESDLFQQLMRQLEINKTRATSFHPQSNAVIERMNRILLNMLSKCIDQNQSDLSSLLPFVLLAYRSSAHESTGFTPYFLVFGHEMSLPLDLMYKPPKHSEPSSLKKQVLERQEAICKAFELVRRNTTAQQLRRSALYNHKVHGPVYKEGDCVLLHYPVTPPGCSLKLSSHRRGPYRIIKCLNGVNYKIEEIGIGKQLIFHYDQLKRYHGVVAPTSIIPARNPISENIPTSKRSKRLDHSNCEYMTFPTTWFLPSAPFKSFYRPQPIATPSAHLADTVPTNTIGPSFLSRFFQCIQPAPRPLVAKRRSELHSDIWPSRYTIWRATAVNTSWSVRKRSILLPLYFPFFPKLHSRLCNCRSLKAPARPSSSGTSPTIHKRIARHCRGTEQSGATLQGPPARKRYRIFLPSKVQKPQSNQAPLTHTNI